MLAKVSGTILIMATLAVAGCHEHGHGKDESSKGHHEHAHVDPDKAAASLTLNNGQKWQTDETLRAGMKAIRDQLQAAVKPIHAETYSPDDYKALAAGIEKEIGNIMSKCKLPPEVDNQIHLVLTQITAGTEAMKKGDKPMSGAVKVIQGLQSYEKFFEHPDWKPIEH